MIEMLYDCFKHWTSNGRLFVLSDPHFNDKENLAMCPDWIPPEKHVAIINKYCLPSDTLLLLGDLGDPEWVKKIKAKKVLVAGNHDNIAQYKDFISEIYTGPLFIAEKILVSHEKIEGLVCVVNIHGHDHTGPMRYNDSRGAKHINVASNVAGWRPINLAEEIKNGLVSDILSIHRITINSATVRAVQKKNKQARKNGQPEIHYERPKKKVKPVQPVQPAKTPEEKQRALCERMCLNCPRASTSDPEQLLAGLCEHHNKKFYLVIDKTKTAPIQKVISFDENLDPPVCTGTQRLITCPSCPAAMATMVSLSKEEVHNKKEV